MSDSPDAADAPAPAFPEGGGLLPVVTQDDASGEVLMVAFMNREAYDETLRTGSAVYFSRSRGRLWRKGESSGHTQEVVRVLLDCDRDAILLRVRQHGPGCCHVGYPTCFYREVADGGLRVVTERAYDPAEVYGPPSDGSPDP